MFTLSKKYAILGKVWSWHSFLKDLLRHVRSLDGVQTHAGQTDVGWGPCSGSK